MTSSIGTINYPKAQPDQTVTKASKIVKKTVTEDGIKKDVCEFWVDFGGAVAQVDTITITAGSAGDDYIIEISNGTDTPIVTYTMQTGDTANMIAVRLVEEINGLPSSSALVTATVTANVITSTASNPGVVIAYDVSGSTTPTNAVVASTTAASGTSKMRKIAESKSYFAIPVGSRNLSVISQTIFYDGANPPNIVRTNTETRANHPQPMESLETTINA